MLSPNVVVFVVDGVCDKNKSCCDAGVCVCVMVDSQELVSGGRCFAEVHERLW